MEYAVIVERKSEIWHAVIPTLSDLSAEGASYEEAVQNAKQAAEDYLSNVVVTTVAVNHSQRPLRPGSKQAVLKAAGKFKGDEPAMLQHIEEIYAERRRQREQAEQELDLLDAA